MTKEETKNCQNCKKDFVIEQEDFNFYERIKVPPPTFCPECRLIRRMAFRNERRLFRRKDANTNQEIFSAFSLDANVLTYENNFWFGDKWDPMIYGRDYDFSKLFFEQFYSVLSETPLPARTVLNLVNSDFCNEASEIKNGYLCFDADYIEDSAYLVKGLRLKETFDSYEVSDSELCYENVMVHKSYKTFFSFDCESCVDVWFSKGLRGCNDCFGCVNLVNKSYHFFNEPYTKENYEKKLKELHLDSFKTISEIREKILNFWLKFPNKYYHGLRAVDSTGEQIYDVRNVKQSFSVREGEHLKYCQLITLKTNNSYDCLMCFFGADNLYETVTCGLGAYNSRFCYACWEESMNLDYCIYCVGSKNCFGCVGLRKKEYCVFNKQYTKEEYEVLVPKIIKHMNDMPYIDKCGIIYKYGEFFPYFVSPYSYNESLAQDFFPLDSEKAEKSGFIWREPNLREYETTLDSKNLPDNIEEVDEKILEEVIKCEKCNRAYRIIPKELQFCKRIGLPLPRFCSNCRFIERFKFINPPKFWHRHCMKEGCQNEFETSYAPERPEIIYCEKCYQQEVY
ncbi:MAG: hypothetical protein WCG45_00745 [bacterium]